MPKETVATPFEEGYRHGLTGCDPRCNPHEDWKNNAEWNRGHNIGCELWRLENEAA